LLLTVPRGLNAKSALHFDWEILDRYEVHTSSLWTVDREEVDLAVIFTAGSLGVGMVAVAAAHCEPNRPLAEPSRLALNARQTSNVVDDEVVTRVLAEWLKHRKTHGLQREHGSEGGPVSDGFRMSHVVAMVNTGPDAGSRPSWPTMFRTPE
jgi:hypothetical protein